MVEELRAAIHRDYDASVLSERDPPFRGDNCQAVIYLKPGAQGKPQRQIRLQGERLEAMTEIAKGWKANGRKESGSGSWRHPSFPVM